MSPDENLSGNRPANPRRQADASWIPNQPQHHLEPSKAKTRKELPGVVGKALALDIWTAMVHNFAVLWGCLSCGAPPPPHCTVGGLDVASESRGAHQRGCPHPLAQGSPQIAQSGQIAGQPRRDLYVLLGAGGDQFRQAQIHQLAQARSPHDCWASYEGIACRPWRSGTPC